MKRMIIVLALLLDLALLAGCGTGDLWFQSELTAPGDGPFCVNVPEKYQRYWGDDLEFSAEQLFDMGCSDIARWGKSGDQVTVSFKLRSWFRKEATVYSVAFWMGSS